MEFKNGEDFDEAKAKATPEWQAVAASPEYAAFQVAQDEYGRAQLEAQAKYMPYWRALTDSSVYRTYARNVLGLSFP